jgi:hypothetical protein
MEKISGLHHGPVYGAGGDLEVLLAGLAVAVAVVGLVFA